MYRISLAVLTVAFLAMALGCESELERRNRMAFEEEERMNVDFEKQLNEIKAQGARADMTSGKSIVSVITKLQDLQQEITGVDPNLRDEFFNTLHRWNDNYLRLARQMQNEVMREANKKVDIQEYDAAIAELNRFPDDLRELGTIWKDIEKYKEAIRAYAEAPGEAHAAVSESEEFVKAKEYEKALERCDRYFKSRAGKVHSPAIYIVINKHISILELVIDEMADKGEYDKALERIEYFKRRYAAGGSSAHEDFLNEKASEIEAKKGAGG